MAYIMAHESGYRHLVDWLKAAAQVRSSRIVMVSVAVYEVASVRDCNASRDVAHSRVMSLASHIERQTLFPST